MMIEVLAIELFAGKILSRPAIVEEVLRAHLSRGGLAPAAQDVALSAKKALATLKEKGLAENPSFGYWRILGENHDSSFDVSSINETTDDSIPDVEEPSSPSCPEPIADVVIGSGDSAVYLYYLPIYRLQAEANEEVCWPCKVGRTDRDPKLRILSQAATALPENPHIALVVKTSRPVALEATIHNVLTLRGRRINESPGAEWFLTSPSEVRAMVDFVLEQNTSTASTA